MKRSHKLFSILFSLFTKKNYLCGQYDNTREEVGEVARVIARRYGDQSSKPGDDLDLADELADVLWVVMCLANQTGIDLDAALERNFAKKTARDKTRHINNEKLTNQ